jgi:hypothetical protein
MIRGLLFFMVAFAVTAHAATTDLSFVSCWPKNQQSNPVSHSVKSEIVASRAHWRAYATVTTNAANGSCQNTTQLYVASPGHDFVPIFRQAAIGTQDGNGIRILGWSPNGKKLLVETTDWAYGSDAELNRAVLVYDAEHAVQTPDVGRSLDERFGGRCLFDYSVIGWKSDLTIVLHVRPFREHWDDRPSCVTRTTAFVYQIDSRILQPF